MYTVFNLKMKEKAEMFYCSRFQDLFNI